MARFRALTRKNSFLARHFPNLFFFVVTQTSRERLHTNIKKGYNEII